MSNTTSTAQWRICNVRFLNKNIVISGTFAHHSRDEYKNIIELHGGKNVSGISKKTTFVLAGENMGPSKLEKAQNLGIKIMSEEKFLQLLQQEVPVENV